MFFLGALKKITSKEIGNIQLKKNITMSFLVKGLGILINFLLVPLTITYVDQTKYGIWLTLASILTWLSFFDIGMGNGLRNRLTIAIALKEYGNAKKYVSTTYAILIIISSFIFVLSFLINPYIDWNSFLNIPSDIDENIHLLLLIVLGAFCIQFVVQLLNTVLTSIHEPATAEVVTFLGQVVLLITILILRYTVTGSLRVLVITFSCVPVTVVLISGMTLYNTRLKSIGPSFKSIDLSFAKSIFNIGAAFFFIQLGALILFQTDNIIIAKILGPESVTKFNVAYKLFSVIIIGFGIVMTPYWSAFTDAYARNDMGWIRACIKKLRKIWLLIAFILVPIFVVSAKFLFKIWLGDLVKINYTLSIAMGGYAICYTCLALNCYFLNGIGKLRIQLLLYFLVSVTNVPLGIVMGKLWGIEGVVLSNIITFVFMNIVLWVQADRILQNKASGIWNS
jgi:O-antigen/teichoic acid export membrane protein